MDKGQRSLSISRTFASRYGERRAVYGVCDTLGKGRAIVLLVLGLYKHHITLCQSRARTMRHSLHADKSGIYIEASEQVEHSEI